MKLKLTAILVAVGFFLQACSSTYDLTPTPQENHPWLEKQYRTYHDVFAETKGDAVEICTTEGLFVGRVTRADGDSIGWINSPQDSTAFLLPTSEVQRLEITHHYNYWWLGGLIGLVGAGWLTYATGGWEPQGGMHLDYSVQPGVVLGVITGAIIGGLAGGAYYHTDQYLTGTHGSVDTTQSHPQD